MSHAATDPTRNKQATAPGRKGIGLAMSALPQAVGTKRGGVLPDPVRTSMWA